MASNYGCYQCGTGTDGLCAVCDKEFTTPRETTGSGERACVQWLRMMVESNAQTGWIETGRGILEHIDALRAQLAATRCPIGLDANPMICSAGACYTCLGIRLAAANEARERAERNHEAVVRGYNKACEANEVLEVALTAANARADDAEAQLREWRRA